MAITKDPIEMLYNAMVKKFVINSTLLMKIDPSRGEPTRGQFNDGLGLGPDLELDSLGVGELRRKFLDSFALICSTSKKGAETASAVCLEQAQARSSSILRVARNHGLSSRDLSGLENVLGELQAVLQTGKPARDTEAVILDIIVDLDKARIMSLVEKAKQRGIGRSVEQALLTMHRTKRTTGPSSNADFNRWLEASPFNPAQTPKSGDLRTKSFVEWSTQARWIYTTQMRSLFNFVESNPPPWLEEIHKIARYYSSVKSMVKFAMKEPGVFSNIQIQVIEASERVSFSVPKRKHLLRDQVESLTDQDGARVMADLSQLWETETPESKFAKACPSELTLHAEMQLLQFYNSNPRCTPNPRFMGTSKKACFFCYEYMRHHHLRFQVSACHQKVYSTWLPPKASTQKDIWKFHDLVKQLAAAELKTDLKGPRRPWARDSTAGPTLTATATAPMGD